MIRVICQVFSMAVMRRALAAAIVINDQVTRQTHQPVLQVTLFGIVLFQRSINANENFLCQVFSGVSTTFSEFAKVIGDVIGKPITYVEVTLEQAEAAMKSRNMPDWLVAHLVAIARAGGKGAFSKENTQPIRDIVGRAPITTRQFAQDFKAAFS